MSTSPWSTATTICWQHVSSATEIARVATILAQLRVDTVIPIISTSAPTLLLTIPEGSNKSSVKRFTQAVSALMQDDSAWESFVRGEFWLCRLTLKSNVRIDITTSIPASEPTEFKL